MKERGKFMEYEKLYKYECPIDFSLNLIAGKWKVLIIWELGVGTKRFTQLEKLLPGITRKVLIEQLKELELYQIIQREVYPQVPPKVEYSLTSQGKELFPVFDSLYKWGQTQIDLLNAQVDEQLEQCEVSNS